MAIEDELISPALYTEEVELRLPEMWKPDKDKRLYIITPTKQSTVRLADLTRLSQTVAHVPNVYWIVVESGSEADLSVWELLHRKERTLGVHYAYIACERDPQENTRGFSERDGALQWLLDKVWPEPMDDGIGKNYHLKHEEGADLPRCETTCKLLKQSSKPHIKKGEFGMVYFADDDNSYDSDLLNEIRLYGRYISMFPVGGMEAGFATPVVLLTNSSLLGLYSGWQGQRVWPTDTAEFAVDLQYMYDLNNNRSAWYVPCHSPRNYGEEGMLLRFGWPEDNKFTILSNNAQLIRVWHVKTVVSPQGCSVPEKLIGVGLNVEELQKSYEHSVNLTRQCTNPPVRWVI